MEKPMTTEGPRICLENLFCTKTNTSPKFVVKTQKESPGICSFNQPSQNDRNWPFHPPLFERPGLVLAGKSWFTYETDGLSMAVYHLSHWAWNQKCQLHLHHPPGFPGHTILNGWADEPEWKRSRPFVSSFEGVACGWKQQGSNIIYPLLIQDGNEKWSVCRWCISQTLRFPFASLTRQYSHSHIQFLWNNHVKSTFWWGKKTPSFSWKHPIFRKHPSCQFLWDLHPEKTTPLSSVSFCRSLWISVVLPVPGWPQWVPWLQSGCDWYWATG